jgi:DNA-binding CsgD family transcriptional regulator
MTFLPLRLPPEVGALFDALQHSPDAVFFTDRQNTVVAWNLSAERLLGYPAEGVLGANCSTLLGGCDVWGNRYCSEHCPVKEMAARAEPVHHFELKLKTPNRGMVAMDLTILQVAAPPPNHFYLAHILHPSQHQPAAPMEEEALSAPPRTSMTAARDSADARARKLTPREVEILGLMAAGRTSGEIASLLSLSTLTVRNHAQNILDKLEVRSKAEAVAFAFQKHLV